MDRIYVQTNAADENEVVAFDRNGDGSLTPLGRFATGGRGSGVPHLASQSSLALDGDRLLVANAGSDEVSLFRVNADGVELAARAASGGSAPTSIAVHGDLAYVLNNGSAGIAGFSLAGGELTPLEGSARSLAAGADPAQIAFSPDGRTLVVTERGTNSISTFAVGADGLAEGPRTIASSGATPYGFDFAGDAVVVTEAFGGEVGAAAASSYALEGGRLEPRSASVADTRSEVCWAAVSKDGRFVYVTNFGDGTISSYAIGADGSIELAEAVAASTRLGEKGVRDEAITGDGRFLYALDADARRIFGWSVGDDGSLSPVGDADGLPETVAGLAAS
ncbi:MAG TPA: beta-propeller fold lactonase family protein [Gaiellaceae bacterium]|nr:beta-propeller fold lactonase family protein [Gaiellaceae bacterium]